MNEDQTAPRAGDSTRAVHAGLPAAADGEPFLPGPTFAAPYHLAGPADASRFSYGRYDNPTWARLEEAIGELEGARAVVFSSGMAAVTAVVVPRLHTGDVLVAPADAYPGIREIAGDVLEPNGVEVRLVPTDDAAYRDGAGRTRRSCGWSRRRTRARHARHPCARRGRARRGSRWSRSTTRSPARCASARSSSAPTSR